MDYFIKPFHELFKELLPIRGILSIWGDYGVGKTTLSFQKGIDHAQNKSTVFIYTKPNFPMDKINLLVQNSKKNPLNNLKIIQSLSFEDLYVLIFNLEFMVLEANKTSKNIELIVIDSITDLYRLELNRKSKERNFLLNFKLNQILANLCFLNEKYKIKILIVNNKTNMNKDGETIETQSGGKAMEYWIDNSLKIIRTNKLNLRKFVYKQKKEEIIIESFSVLTAKGFIDINTT